MSPTRQARASPIICLSQLRPLQRKMGATIGSRGVALRLLLAHQSLVVLVEALHSQREREIRKRRIDGGLIISRSA